MLKLLGYIFLAPFYLIYYFMKIPAMLFVSLWRGLWSMVFLNDVDKFIHKR